MNHKTLITLLDTLVLTRDKIAEIIGTEDLDEELFEEWTSGTLPNLHGEVLKSIHAGYQELMAELETLIDLDPDPGTIEAKWLDVLSEWIQKYEAGIGREL